jgi:uncharacterized protein (TIGR03067 family)
MLKNVTYWFICFLTMGAITTAWCAEVQDSFEGTWIVDSLETDGRKAPKAAIKHLSFRFAGDKLFIKGNFGDEREDESSFVLDQTKEPKHLDFTPPEENKPILAIYERKGKTLNICVRHAMNSDKGRPTEFKTTPDSSGLVLIVLSLKEEESAQQ